MTASPTSLAQGAAAPRIASLVPSVTETLVALGLGPYLVARTGYCLHPAAALAAVPKVGGTKDVNLAKLRRIAPTHAVVNVDENRLATLEALRTFVPDIVVTHPCAPDDVPALIEQLQVHFGALPGVADRANALLDELRRELAVAAAGPPVPALCLIWREPWMTVARDTYVSRLLSQGGWQTWPAVDGGRSGAARYPVLRGDEPWLGEVREVLLPSEPYAFGPAHVPEVQAMCPAARVRLVDGERLTWYGARTPEGLRYVRELAGCP